MTTMNVSILDHMKVWVEQQASSGRCANASDYVRHLIRCDQERLKTELIHENGDDRCLHHSRAARA